MKYIIHGATGRMGQNLCSLAGENLVAAVSPELTTDPARKQYYALAEYTGEADMIVDFSHHTAVSALLDYAKSRKLPVVIGTTGHTEDEKACIEAAAQEIPVFYSRNMSVGVALLVQLRRLVSAETPYTSD